MATLSCWNCGNDVSDEPLPLSRQASCHKCGEFLHCCRLCIHYAPGKPGDCVHDLADPPTEKSSANFCDYFKPNFHLSASANSNDDARAKLDALFGDAEFGDEKVGDDKFGDPTATEKAAPEKATPEKPSGNSSNPLDDLFDD